MESKSIKTSATAAATGAATDTGTGASMNLSPLSQANSLSSSISDSWSTISNNNGSAPTAPTAAAATVPVYSLSNNWQHALESLSAPQNSNLQLSGPSLPNTPPSPALTTAAAATAAIGTGTAVNSPIDSTIIQLLPLSASPTASATAAVSDSISTGSLTIDQLAAALTPTSSSNSSASNSLSPPSATTSSSNNSESSPTAAAAAVDPSGSSAAASYLSTITSSTTVAVVALSSLCGFVFGLVLGNHYSQRRQLKSNIIQSIAETAADTAIAKSNQSFELIIRDSFSNLLIENQQELRRLFNLFNQYMRQPLFIRFPA